MLGGKWIVQLCEPSKQLSNYLSRVSHSRIKDQVTVGFYACLPQRNYFHGMVSLGHSLIPTSFVCMWMRVCRRMEGVYVCLDICWHTWYGMSILAFMDGVALVLRMRCVKETVTYHFPHITLHDFPPIGSHPGQLSPTILKFPGHSAFTCLLKRILSLYSGLDT